MHTWQLQEAKAKFSKLVRLCSTDGPQIITVRSKEEAVLLSKREYDALTKSNLSFLELMNQSPFKGVELDIDRDKSMPRDTDALLA
ncbi:MAG: type II toxin-antitoxin system Phd/YefM family antitoxin [Proteobacteria bacterium]|nr:type II toxin-antitoxin system Phd/YefM family antitoxin [Pseudomonadota bacterium]